MPLLSGHGTQGDQINRRLSEHDAAYGIQLPCHDIQTISQPGSDTAERLGAGAHAGVERCFGCVRKLVRKATDGFSRNACALADDSRSEGQGGQAQKIQIFYKVFCGTWVD